MAVVFALLAIALILKDLRTEWQRGGTLYIDLRPARRELAAIDEQPLPFDWDRDDVVRTLGEIEAL